MIKKQYALIALSAVVFAAPAFADSDKPSFGVNRRLELRTNSASTSDAAEAKATDSSQARARLSDSASTETTNTEVDQDVRFGEDKKLELRQTHAKNGTNATNAEKISDSTNGARARLGDSIPEKEKHTASFGVDKRLERRVAR